MSDPTNTDAQTSDMDAQTTPDAGGTPLAPDAAAVTLPDGSTPPLGDDGLPVLSGDEDDDEDAPTEPAGHRLGARSGMSGFRGLLAKRAERAARRAQPEAEPEPVAPDTDEERAAALALAAEKGYTEADLIDSDGNPLDVAGIHRSLQVEGEGDDESGADDGDEGAGSDDGGDEGSTPDAAAVAADDGAEEVIETTPGTEDEPPTIIEGEPVEEVEEVVVEESEEVVDEPEPAKPADEGFDPSAHTVTEVQAYLGEHPDQAEYVLDRERANKARVTLIGA